MSDTAPAPGKGLLSLSFGPPEASEAAPPAAGEALTASRPPSQTGLGRGPAGGLQGQRWQAVLLAVFSGSRLGAAPSGYTIVAFGHTTARLPAPSPHRYCGAT